MQLYAEGSRGWRQAMADVGVAAWTVLCAAAAWLVHGAVRAVGEPSRRTADTLHRMIAQLEEASTRLAKVPGVGDELGLPFRAMARLLEDLARHAGEQVSAVNGAATALAVLVFLIPMVLVVSRWLPHRTAFVRDAAAARGFVDDEADLDLFALRAMANVPMHELARVSDDPVGEWREGNQEVIRRLAALEVKRLGLAMPPADLAARPASARPVPPDED